MKSLSLLVFSIVSLSFYFAEASLTKEPETDQERCLMKLEAGGANYTYKFIKSNSALQYEILEIPKEAKADSYVRYYSDKGYAEINAGSAACNHKTQLNNVNAKLIEVFKTADENVVRAQTEVDSSIAKKSKGDVYPSGLATFRDVCAKAFPAIREYLQRRGQLPKALKSPSPTNCLDPNSPVRCGEAPVPELNK